MGEKLRFPPPVNSKFLKKIILGLVLAGLGITGAFATLPGTDNAADPAYSDGWVTGDNGGTTGTFLPWDLTSNNNGGGNSAGHFIGSSTDGSGDINTNGVSFGVYANPNTAFADANRSFGGALDVGQTFSLQIAVNFHNGNKGFNLYDTGSVQAFNFNVGSDDSRLTA